MAKPKHEVVFSPRAGWAYHARVVGAVRTVCGRATGGWATMPTVINSIECKLCRRKLKLGPR